MAPENRTHDELRDEQNYLIETLESVWSEWARKVILVTLISVMIGVGIAVGVMWSTHVALRQTAEIIRSLNRQVEINRQKSNGAVENRDLEQRRYQVLTNRLQIAERKLKRYEAGAKKR